MSLVVIHLTSYIDFGFVVEVFLRSLFIFHPLVTYNKLFVMVCWCLHVSNNKRGNHLYEDIFSIVVSCRHGNHSPITWHQPCLFCFVSPCKGLQNPTGCYNGTFRDFVWLFCSMTILMLYSLLLTKSRWMTSDCWFPRPDMTNAVDLGRNIKQR